MNIHIYIYGTCQMYGRHAATNESVWASGNQRQGITEYVVPSTGYNATLRSEDEAALTNLCSLFHPGLVLGSDDLLDAVHLLLVLLTVSHGAFFGLSQSRLQDLHPLSSCTQALLQFGQLTS